MGSKMAKTLQNVLESFEFNRAALAKQRLQNLRHLGRKVRGARIANLMRAAGLKEEELDETDLDQLDEVLNADAAASDWIHDFVHSSNPKFEGKTKKERIKMALGAYYHKSRHKDGEGLGEQLEQGTEMSQEQLDEVSYSAKKAAAGEDIGKPGKQFSSIATKAGNKYGSAAAGKRVAGSILAKLREAKKEDKKEDPPFEPDAPKKNPVAKAGKYGQGYSTARHLARQGMKQAMKEEYGVEIDDEVADQILEAAKQYAGLEKEDKPGKIKTAIVKTHEKAVGSETVEGWKDAKKPVKESYDEEGNVTTMSKTYQEFMEGMTATKVAPNVTRYTGGSYGNAKGAKYGNTDYDKETLDTKDDESGEAQAKRGRGRPAGSKSGARGPRVK